MNETLHVLNLEDEPRDAELTQAMISARWPDCRFLRVDNRDAFTHELERGGQDIILSDYTMPSFSGTEALSLARQRHPEVPFIFVSGTIGEDTAIESLKRGATDYVLKHRLMRLIPAVDRALREVGERAVRRQAEEAMRMSEHKYRELFESLDDAAFLSDQISGKIIDANRSAERLLGCARGEILGRTEDQFLRLRAEESPHASPAPAEAIRAGRPPTQVSIHATKLTLYGRQLILRLCRENSGAATG